MTVARSLVPMSLSLSADEIIDYDALHDEYLTSLVDRLRGFAPRVDYLHLWVPDDDPISSLRNMLDAAATVGRKNLGVRVGPRFAARIDDNEAAAMADRFGRATVQRDRDTLWLEVLELRAATQPNQNESQSHTGVAPDRAIERRELGPLTADSIECSRWGQAVGPAYQRRLADAVSTMMADQSPNEAAGRVVVAAALGGLSLSLQIEPQHHRIERVAFAGVTSELGRALFCELAAVIGGLPLLEAVQHGVIRLEHRLRDRELTRPLPGVVSPEAADPIFRLPTLLLRAALAGYRERTGFSETDNRYDPRPGTRWLAATDAMRARVVLEAVSELGAREGFDVQGLELARVEYEVRVVLVLPPSWPERIRPGRLLAIERELKRRVDPRLEVFAEELRDKNKLRRLSVVKVRTNTSRPEAQSKEILP